jgi:hypothetical protein
MQSTITVQDGVTWKATEGAKPKVLDSYANYSRWAIGPLMSKAEWEESQRRLHSGRPQSTNPYEW